MSLDTGKGQTEADSEQQSSQTRRVANASTDSNQTSVSASSIDSSQTAIYKGNQRDLSHQHHSSPSGSQSNNANPVPHSPRIKQQSQPLSPRLPFLPIGTPTEGSFSGARRTASRPPGLDSALASHRSASGAGRPQQAPMRPPNPRSTSSSVNPSNRLSVAGKSSSGNLGVQGNRARAKSKSKRSVYATSATGTSDGDEDDDLISDGYGSDMPQSNANADAAANDQEDDEVEPVDRGEELVRRRMKERKREKKRLAALAAQQQASFARRASSRPPQNRPTSSLANVSSTSENPDFYEGFEAEEGFAAQESSSYTGPSAAQTPVRPDFPRQSTAQNNIPHSSGGILSAENTSYFSNPQHGQGTSSVPMSPMGGHPAHDLSVSDGQNTRRGHSELGRRVSYALSNAPAQPQDNDGEDEQSVATTEDRRRVENYDQADDETDESEAERQLSRAGRFGEHVDSDEEDNNELEDVEYTLKDRQDAINIEHPFGLPIWKPALYKKSRSVTRNAEREMHLTPSSAAERHLLPGNIVWTILFGSWLALISFVLSAVLWCIPWGGSKYGRVLFELGVYLFWPFGRYVEGFDVGNLFDPGYESGEEKSHAGLTAADTGYDDSDGESFDVEAAGRTWSRKSSRPSFPSSEATQATARGDRSISRTPRASRTASGQQIAFHGEEGEDDDDVTPPATGNERTALLNNNSGNVRAVDYGAAVSTSGSSTAVDIEGSPKALDANEHAPQLPDYNDAFRVRALGRLCYWAVFYLVLAPLMLIVCLLCWGLVFSVPMAKLLWALVRYLSKEPLALHFRSEPKYHPPADNTDAKPPLLKAGQLAPKHSPKVYAADRGAGRLVGPRAQVLLCTYKAFGIQYYKYTIDGVNIMFINLLPVLFFVIFDFFFLHSRLQHATGFVGFITSQGTIFVLALLSVIPLSYFIGMAVASISAQSSIGMGAVINATFGSIIEVILYSIALTQGKSELVEGSIVGSLIAGVLLMPGFSMVSGAIRRKEQKFNARSAGVTSTMLIMAIIGTLTPTLFYEIYGTFQLTCDGCPPGSPAGEAWRCSRCAYQHVDPVDDPFYKSTVQYLSYTCAICLVLSYLVGLWFSLRTHASQIWQNQQSHAPASAPQSAVPPALSQRTLNKQRPALDVFHKLSQGMQRGHNKDVSMATEDSHARPVSVASNVPPTAPSHAGPHTSNTAFRLPSGMTTEEFTRAVDIVAATASAFKAQQSDATMVAGTPLRRQFSRSSHVQEPSHAQEPSHLPPVEATQGHHTANAGTQEHGGGGHDAPNWSRLKSASVLMGCTILYAIIAEILVDVVDVVLDGSGIPEKFLGITLFALVPNTTEFMNAISFALNGNIALSMEIGSAYALQVCLLQIPAMIAFTAFYALSRENMIHHAFTLVFPRWDVIAILFSVFLLTYVYLEARANYYRGAILIFSYIVLMAGFYFAPPGLDTEDNPGFQIQSAQLSYSGLHFWQHVKAVFLAIWTP